MVEYQTLNLCSRVTSKSLDTSVGSEPKLSSARFWLELLGEKARLGSARHAFKKARLAISCKKSSVQLSLLYHLKITSKDVT